MVESFCKDGMETERNINVNTIVLLSTVDETTHFSSFSTTGAHIF